ncbi:hypothetical protein [Desulfonema magnum]|uniref:Uncharacterized protein n=1 Tax=Desulfonema magnum TaxID=45655 RepID=A0A975C0A0_9BACT|nr:hypothetical protein [Desulfonema magnum]QTA93714.1 Uncharacterized protein dnm_098180 [Desulfonema magnum]
MNPPIIPADKKLRKQTIVALLICIPIGLFLIQSLSAYIEEFESLIATDIELATVKIKKLLTIITVINAIFSSALALHLSSLAIKILKSGCYPPPGMRVIKDTPLQIGKKAKNIGTALIFTALLILSTNIILWYVHVMLDQLISI